MPENFVFNEHIQPGQHVRWGHLYGTVIDNGPAGATVIFSNQLVEVVQHGLLEPVFYIGDRVRLRDEIADFGEGTAVAVHDIYDVLHVHVRWDNLASTNAHLSCVLAPARNLQGLNLSQAVRSHVGRLMKPLDQRIAHWGRETFPEATVHQVMDKLMEEVHELRHEIARRGFSADPATREEAFELADCMIVLVRMADLLGVNISDAVEAKFRIVQSRDYRQMNGRSSSDEQQTGEQGA